jgi:uncharacterized protein
MPDNKNVEIKHLKNTGILPEKTRTGIIDVLRGWALLGVVIVNFSIFYNLGIETRAHLELPYVKFLMGIVQVLFGSKSWTLLSFLFGYGFSILLNNLKSKSVHPNSFFIRRMFWLVILGIINSCFYFGDILKDYALMGLFLLMFQNMKSKNLLCIALLFLLFDPLMNAWVVAHRTPSEFSAIIPHLSWYTSQNILKPLAYGAWASWKLFFLPFIFNVRLIMLSCFLIGMSLQKIAFFEHLKENMKLIRRTFWFSWIFIIFLFTVVIINQALKLNFGIYYYVINWFTLALTVIIATGICWIYNTNKFNSIFESLRLYGRMTLTNYVMQNMIGLLLFSGVGLRLINTMPYYFYLVIALVIYILQVLLSSWWLGKYNFGPLEWAWRCLSYNRKLPLKRMSI